MARISRTTRSTPSAAAIRSALAKTVVGQERATTQISVLLAMHLAWPDFEDKSQRPPRAILVGPTGVGKTHTLRAAAEFLSVPFVVADSSSLVPPGIVGRQIEDVLEELVAAAREFVKREHSELRDEEIKATNHDIAIAERGIIFFDEFDKLGSKAPNVSESSDPSSLVQRHILKLLEGALMPVGVKRHEQDYGDRRIDTSGILVVAAGAFSGIDSPSIRTKRPAVVTRLLNQMSVDQTNVMAHDVVAYGFLPELVARLPVLIEFDPLDESQLREILLHQEVSPLEVWRQYFNVMGKELFVPDDTVDFIVRFSHALGLGARGLAQTIFPALAKSAYMYETSSEQVLTLQIEDFSEVLV
jgi:ATP-dependent Clp protease ATP-binding subunit ClpX